MKNETEPAAAIRLCPKQKSHIRQSETAIFKALRRPMDISSAESALWSSARRARM